MFRLKKGPSVKKPEAEGIDQEKQRRFEGMIQKLHTFNSDCANKLIEKYMDRLIKINNLISKQNVVHMYMFLDKFLNENDLSLSYYWTWYFSKRENDIKFIADKLGIIPNSMVGYKTTPEFALYFILILLLNDLAEILLRYPTYIMFVLSMISPLILETSNLREIINMFADICKNINFEYVCDKRGEDIEYTCGRYIVYNEQNNTIEIMQTTSMSNDTVLNVDVKELKENNNIAEQFTINCVEDTRVFQEGVYKEKYLKYKAKYLNLKKKFEL